MQLLSGVAGSRGRNPYGVVIHNDAASQGATTNYYRNWLPSHDAALGFAHYYVCSDGTLQAEYEENMAWHTANANGNANYIGIEACQSMGNLATFQDNEQRSIKLAAEILKRYGLQPNRNTVILHKQFSSTACPHRSVTLHGDWTVMQDYFIAQIQKYMNGNGTNNNSSKPEEKPVLPQTEEEDIMFIYEKKQKNGNGTDVYFVFGNKRMHLPTTTHVKEAQDLIARYGGSKTRQVYGNDNFGVAMIEKATELVK